jgi:hypothetical protein
VPHPLWQWASVFRRSAPLSRLLRHTKDGRIYIRILTGSQLWNRSYLYQFLLLTKWMNTLIAFSNSKFPRVSITCFGTCTFLDYKDWLIDWLIDYLRFYVPLNHLYIRRRHHCRWRAAKFRPKLGTKAFQQDLYRATPPHSIASYNTQGDAEDLFKPGSSRVSITMICLSIYLR